MMRFDRDHAGEQLRDRGKGWHAVFFQAEFLYDVGKILRQPAAVVPLLIFAVAQRQHRMLKSIVWAGPVLQAAVLPGLERFLAAVGGCGTERSEVQFAD